MTIAKSHSGEIIHCPEPRGFGPFTRFGWSLIALAIIVGAAVWMAL